MDTNPSSLDENRLRHEQQEPRGQHRTMEIEVRRKLGDVEEGAQVERPSEAPENEEEQQRRQRGKEPTARCSQRATGQAVQEHCPGGCGGR